MKTRGILYIDEFGSSLHPDLGDYIIKLFRSHPEIQLVINTHDTSLMRTLRREEIIFTEKNQAEESIITPLMHYSPKKEDVLEKRYRQGLYGARPFIQEEL